MKKIMQNFNFSNKNSLAILLTVVLISVLLTYIFVSSLQALLLLLWGVQQTKLQIFIVIAAIKLITM